MQVMQLTKGYGYRYVLGTLLLPPGGFLRGASAGLLGTFGLISNLLQILAKLCGMAAMACASEAGNRCVLLAKASELPQLGNALFWPPSLDIVTS